MRVTLSWAFAVAGVIALSACGTNGPESSPYVQYGIGGGSSEVVEGEDGGLSIFLVDRRGKRWNITHAVAEYGFDPDRFQYGLGMGAIAPVFDPVFLSPGDEGYPPSDRSFGVVGASFDGDDRAYSIADIRRHEVVNERFGDAHVAVAY